MVFNQSDQVKSRVSHSKSAPLHKVKKRGRPDFHFRVIIWQLLNKLQFLQTQQKISDYFNYWYNINTFLFDVSHEGQFISSSE